MCFEQENRYLWNISVPSFFLESGFIRGITSNSCKRITSISQQYLHFKYTSLNSIENITNIAFVAMKSNRQLFRLKETPPNELPLRRSQSCFSKGNLNKYVDFNFVIIARKKSENFTLALKSILSEGCKVWISLTVGSQCFGQEIVNYVVPFIQGLNRYP